MRNPNAPSFLQSAGQVSPALAEVHAKADAQEHEFEVAKKEAQWNGYAVQRNAA